MRRGLVFIRMGKKRKKLCNVFIFVIILLGIIACEKQESVPRNVEQGCAIEQQANTIKELPRSLGITIVNIDLSTVHDTNPLEKEQRALLIEYGYSLDQIAKMDAGDFMEAERVQMIPKENLESIKNSYCELKELDISSWTWGDFEEYCKKKDRENAFSAEEQDLLAKRNITIDDARYLLKEYHSIDNLLIQDDSILKEYLEVFYKNKISYAKAMSKRDYSWMPK